MTSEKMKLLVTEAVTALAPTFTKIDLHVKANLERVLQAFRDRRVGAHHFASVSGYGHGDMGRDVLDEVFAQVMGAESAAVRVQFVSGTHAIACPMTPSKKSLAIPSPLTVQVLTMQVRSKILGLLIVKSNSPLKVA